MQWLFNPRGMPAAYGVSIEVQVPANGRVGGYKRFFSQMPNERLSEAAGSESNPYPFTLLQADLNDIKGSLASGVNPVSSDRIDNSLRLAARGERSSPTNLGRLFGAIRNVSSK
jgi:hypothetical protein